MLDLMKTQAPHTHLSCPCRSELPPQTVHHSVPNGSHVFNNGWLMRSPKAWSIIARLGWRQRHVVELSHCTCCGILRNLNRSQVEAMRLASYAESDRMKRLMRVLVQRGNAIGVLLFTAGVVTSLVLVREDINRGMYFDENALMAGLVRREYGDMDDISSLVRHLELAGETEKEVVQWVGRSLSEIGGMEVYWQNYSVNIPVVALPSKTGVGVVQGSNVYGIWRAGRSASTEALVLTAPAFLNEGGCNYALPLLLSLAKYFSRKNYWSKDLIFLVTTRGEAGMQAWLNAYMGEQNNAITHNRLQGRSGAIQAAINLEAASTSIQHVSVIAEGINGILPNMDIVYVAVQLCEAEHLKTAYHVPWTGPYWHSPWVQYQYSLLTLGAVMAHQAAGLPFTNHAMFLRHRIDSLTLRTIPGKGSDMIALGRALEGTFRSLNNLLERLHHSVFFYLTPSRSSFIAVSQYIPAFALLLTPLILEGLKQWVLVHNKEQLLNNDFDSHLKRMGIPAPFVFPFQPFMHILLLCVCSGVLLLLSPLVIMTVFGSPISPSILFTSMLCVCAVSIIIPLVTRPSLSESSWRLCKAMLLLVIITFLFGLSLVNFSLSFFLAISLSLPLYLITGHCNRFLSAKQLLLIFVSPPCLGFFSCLVYTALFVSADHDILELVNSSFKLLLTGVAFSYTSSLLYNSWLFTVLCLCVWPQWLAFWCLSCSVDKMNGKEETKTVHLHTD